MIEQPLGDHQPHVLGVDCPVGLVLPDVERPAVVRDADAGLVLQRDPERAEALEQVRDVLACEARYAAMTGGAR